MGIVYLDVSHILCINIYMKIIEKIEFKLYYVNIDKNWVKYLYQYIISITIWLINKNI